MLDAITEAISHFVGYFHLSTEEMRLRTRYDEFLHRKARMDEGADDEPRPDEPSEFQPDGYRPDLDWLPKAWASEDPQDQPMVRLPEPPLDLEPPALHHANPPAGLPFADDAPPALAAVPAAPPAPPAPQPGPVATPTLPPPGSVETVTLQVIRLLDDDAFGDVDAAGLAAPESFAPRLDRLTEAAEALTALTPTDPSGDAPWVGTAQALKADLAAAAKGTATGEAPDGAEVATVVGPAALDLLVDGRAADAMPTLAELRPDPAPSGDASGGDEAADLAGGVPGATPTATSLPPGHHVEAGGNAATNEATVTTNWLDARVIAVKGDVTQVDAISQVNVLSDADDLGALAAPPAASDLVNAARIDRTSSEPGGAAPAEGAGLPSGWAVSRIEGDLVTYNWVKQLTFTSDHDRAVVTSTGSGTAIELGGNEAANATAIAEIGYRFDLILVGGDMVDVNLVSQRNVLLDDDRVEGAPGASGGGNLLFNGASIVSTGIDGFGRLAAPFEGAIDAMAKGGGLSMLSSVAADGLFHGVEFLRVLFIEGDLVSMNVVEQVNVMGDADQVRVALAAADPGAAVTVSTGGNLLANVAAFDRLGVDSTVMAGGEVYSDALIHQAGFLDPDAPPAGVSLPALSSEAVAFLADGMIDAPGGRDHDGGGHAPAMDGGGLDVMQTMLA